MASKESLNAGTWNRCYGKNVN